ncbi:MAG: zinc-binding dehydrogenase [Dehalococcoidia bacterium]|nr:zinc-binding dehydrogenase [Dehalococcoidia bacterium]
MRAAVVTAYGPFDGIRVSDVDAPAPGPGDVLVRVSVAGVNFADAGMVRGTARRAEPPFTPGVEAAGTVDALGAEVSSLSAGERVVYWNPMPSAFAELAVVPAWRAVPIPEGVTDEVAVALMVQGTTAHYLATDSFDLRPGTTCLVHAAAGGVGHLLVQIAVARGARVIAAVGSEEKTRLARDLGADVVINRGERDVLEAVREATGGEGVDVVYDAVGQATIEASLQATRRRGTCVLFGAASGPVTGLEALLGQRGGSIFWHRPGLGDHMQDEAEVRRRMGDLFAWHLAGQVTPHIGGEWPLDGVPEAIERVAGGQTTGKVLIRP